MRNYLSGYYPGVTFQPINDPSRFFTIVSDNISKGVTSTDHKFNVIFGSLVSGYASNEEVPDTFVSFISSLLATT